MSKKILSTLLQEVKESNVHHQSCVKTKQEPEKAIVTRVSSLEMIPLYVQDTSMILKISK